jgi:hypothetical protein
MANTTWNPSDKSANCTLSGGNLIGTATGANAWVRAVDKQVTGKFYWEAQPTVWVNGNTGIGFCGGGLAAPSGATVAGMVATFKAGPIYVDTVNTGKTLGARAANDIIGIAVDLNARLIWFRVAPAGNWNGDATANPATGAGGVSFTILGIGIQAYPVATFGTGADAITANFGNSAFSGTVPSGFTSGFTSGVVSPSNALATQLAAEHWLTTNPAAQITQVALEHWATVTGTGIQAIATQLALEHWATVALVSTSQPRVMVMA